MAATRPWAVPAAASFACISYAIAWACVLVYVLFQIAVALPYWTRASDPDNPWQQFRTEVSIRYDMLKDGKLFTGRDVMMLVFAWLPMPVAIIATMAPALILSKPLREAAYKLKPMAIMSSFYRRVRRVALTPLWPHKFWLWWCNGFTVLDFLIWGGFLAINILGVWQWTELGKRKYIGWDALGLRYPQPKSVYNLKYIGLAFGWVLGLPLSMLFMPVAHVSFLHTLLGTSWAAFIKYHRWLGHFTMWMLLGHGVFFYLYWICHTDLDFWSHVLDWNAISGVNDLAGSISGLGGLILWITALTWVRRNLFTLFYVSHIIGALVFVVFGLLHYSKYYLFMMPGLILWGVDVVFRVFQAQHVSAVSSAQLTPSGNLVRLEIPLDPELAAKGIKAGHEVFLQFPDISRWSWHPFTVYKINMPTEEGVLPSMTIAIKKFGSWTKKLLTQLEMHGACIPVRVVGPVGGLHTLGHAAPRVLLFVGGIGASPALAHVNAMIDAKSTTPTTVVFVARDVEEFSILDDRLLVEAGRQDKPWLQIKLFLTGGIDRKRAGDIAAIPAARSSTDSGSLSSPTSGGMDPKLKVLASGTGSMLRGEAGAAAGFPTTPIPDVSCKGLCAFGRNLLARPMQSRLLNDWQLLLAILLACLGGYLGAVQAQTGNLENRDAPLVGLMFLGCISVQMVGLPTMLVVFPVHLHQYFKSKDRGASMVAMPKDPYIQGHLGGDLVGSMEVAPPLVMTHGRPNIRELIHEALQGVTGDEMPVVVAGPTTMMHQVELEAWKANWKRDAGSPFLRVIRETHFM